VRVTLLTYGTRGDVQPFVALGAGLQRAGCSVRLAAPQVFAPLVAPYPIEFVPLPGDPRELGRIFVDRAASGLVTMLEVLHRYVLPIAAGVMRGVQAACHDADAIVHSFLMTVAGHTAACDLGLPDFSAQIFPVFAPTAAFPSLGLVRRFPDGAPRFLNGVPHLGTTKPQLGLPDLRGTLNRLSHHVFNSIYVLGNWAGYRRLRRDVPDLPPRIHWPFARPWPFAGAAHMAHPTRAPTPLLFAFSRHVVPPPPDWGADVHLTGYWFLESSAAWQPPAALETFLRAGPPPVCIGFGSMLGRDLPALGRVALQALARSGRRGVLVGGWAELERLDLPPAVPHDWLFQRAAAVVHHGGAGVTAAALCAGIPSVVIPLAADQPFWGQQVHRLGAGPPPIPRRRLTAERLAAALSAALTDDGMRARARDLGVDLRAEDGVAQAVQIIRRTVAAWPTPGHAP
jgi:sterol 3beta-glucosyltransferase